MSECSRLIMSENARDYILEYKLSREYPLNKDGVCIQCVNDEWCLLYADQDAVTEEQIAGAGYFTIPKLYGLMDTTSFDESGITQIINQPFLNARGKGIIIGFVDTGIDYLSDFFKTGAVNSKIEAIWDQTIQREGVNEEDDKKSSDLTRQNFRVDQQTEFENEDDAELQDIYSFVKYGTVYTRKDIENAIKAEKDGLDPYSVVPSKDNNGHGTFLAGVAAASPGKEYTGAAPEAEILMVKLKPAKQYLREYFLVKEVVECFEENDIMQGVRFLQYYAAKMGKPLVICIGMGSMSGPRTGATPLATYLSSLAVQINTVVVTCIGNEANERCHITQTAVSNSEPSQIEISIGKGAKGFSMEIWSKTRDVLSVSIESPSGQIIPRIPARLGESNIFNFLFENTQVTVDYKLVETVSGLEVIFIRFISPAEGIWKIDVYSLTNISGEYNAWLPLRQFMRADNFILNSTPDTTLIEPSAAARLISVGAYNHVTGADYIQSSRGYNVNGIVKPDLIAPGVDVTGLRPLGGFTQKTGTSVAAAHVAGAAADILSWGFTEGNYPYMNTNDVKFLMIRGAKRDEKKQYPNPVEGYGKLDLLETFLQMRTT